MNKIIKSQKYFLAISLSIVFILIGSTARADKVTPSNRVSNYLNVREQPDVNSAIIGTLPTGQSAELIESIPYWYRIKLIDGSTGYVSKAWAVKIINGSAASSETGKSDLIIGSWNIKWFGYYSEDKHDYSRMADIIQKMDVVAIQELRGSGYKDRLDKLVNALAVKGFNYKYVFSDETGYLNNPDKSNTTLPKKDYLERYAFLWDTDRVQLVNAAAPYKFVSNPIINNATFRQVPIYTDFKVKRNNGFDFRILTIHTVYNSNINAVRKAEIEFVNNWIINQVNDASNPEKNIVVVGDFNANPDNQPHHFDNIIDSTHAYRVLFYEPLKAGEPSLRTTIQQSKNPGPHYFEKPVYDHALVSNETSYALPHDPMTRGAKDLGVVEFDQDAYWKNLHNWNAVIKAMSDHRPIWFRVDYMAADMD